MYIMENTYIDINYPLSKHTLCASLHSKINNFTDHPKIYRDHLSSITRKDFPVTEMYYI